jgi:hypothetical protein
MEKISKAQVKLIKSLQLKKYRDELGLFVAEGEKCVEELRKAFELVYHIQTAEKPLPDLPLKGQELSQLSVQIHQNVKVGCRVLREV